MADEPDVVGKLRSFAEGGDSRSVANLCVEVGWKQLVTFSDEIASMQEDLRAYRNDEPFVDGLPRWAAAGIATLASRRTLAQAATSIDYPATEPDIDIVVAMLDELRPKWLSKLPNRLVKNQWQPQWRLGRALVVAGLSEAPTDSRYLDQLSEIGMVASTLRRDPALLDDVWRILEGEGSGTFSTARTLFDDLLDSRFPQLAETPDEDRFWTSGLIALIEDDLIDRNALIDAALIALRRHSTWPKLRWHAALLDELEVQAGERADRSERFAALLASPLSPVVGLAQRECRTLIESGSIRPEEFFPYAAAPFFLKQKGVAIEQIDLIVALGDSTEWRNQAAECLGPALGHSRDDVSARAAEVLIDWWSALSSETKDRVHAFSLNAPPAARSRWKSLVAESADEPSGAPIAWTPPPQEPMPEPFDDDDLVRGLASMLERQAEPMIVERVIEACLRIAGHPLDRRKQLLEPVAARAQSMQYQWDFLDGWAVDCMDVLTGKTPQRRAAFRDERLHEALLSEVLAHLGAARSRPYVAMPDHSDGRIDPEHLEARLSTAVDLGPAEELVCRLRADAAYDLLSFSDVKWSPAGDRRVYDATATVSSTIGHDVAYFAGDTFGRAPTSTWSFTVTPHHLDPSVVGDRFGLSEGMEKDSGFFAGGGLPDLLDRLIDPAQHPGELAPLIVAMGLGAKPDRTRLLAVDALLSLSQTKRVSNSDIVDAVTRLALAGRLVLTRLATALRELLDRAPALARDQSLAVLAETADVTGAHALATLACDAVTLAGPGAIPGPLTEIARGKSSSKLAKELRRVVELST